MIRGTEVMPIVTVRRLTPIKIDVGYSVARAGDVESIRGRTRDFAINNTCGIEGAASVGEIKTCITCVCIDARLTITEVALACSASARLIEAVITVKTVDVEGVNHKRVGVANACRICARCPVSSDAEVL